MDKNRLRNAILNATARNAALVIKNANIVNVFNGTIEKGDVAMRDGVILGIGTYSGREEIDANGAFHRRPCAYRILHGPSPAVRRVRAEAGHHHRHRGSP